MACLAVVAITEVIKRFVAFFYPPVAKSSNSLGARIWKQLVLPTVPTLLGAGVLGLLTDFSASNVFTGLVLGMFSTLVYRMVRKSLLAKAPADP